MNILDTIRDPHLFRPFVGSTLRSWRPWLAALRAVYGLNPRPADRKVIAGCTGRDPEKLPPDGFQTSLFLTGRRSGKSRIAAIIAAYEGCLAGREKKLSRGERGLVAVCAPTKRQGHIVKGYIRGIFETPMLAAEIVAETREGFELRSGVEIRVMAGDFRTIRGFSLLACVVDEVCFFGLEAESKVRSDTELIRAVRPGLATTGGKLVCISSKYAPKGWAFQTAKQTLGNDAARTLVWEADSRTMNSTLSQSIIDDALAEDPAAARSEYLNQWRDDVAAFLPRDVIERCVIAGRAELQPRKDIRYCAFADMSGGRSDSATLAIAHHDEGEVILDYLREWRPPFNPQQVIGDMAEALLRFGLRRVTGDNYSAEFTASSFKANNIRYQKADKPASALYLELLPRLCSGEIELLDHPRLIDQLANLERRTRSGGKDVIDHPAGGHDDLSNAVAGVAVASTQKSVTVGAF
jgi:hypothetical protein